MIIDLHFHTKKYSSCSKISLEEGIKRAKEIGLDGICLTEHDVIPKYDNIEELEEKYGIKIFIGCEIYTLDGDILCFGLDEIPKHKISASELIDKVSSVNGATIAAHPFRDNGRGMGNKIAKLKGLTAVEAYNGNTDLLSNIKAHQICITNNIRVTGSSDAHSLDKIGVYATKFSRQISTVKELIFALKEDDYVPVQTKQDPKHHIFVSLHSY